MTQAERGAVSRRPDAGHHLEARVAAVGRRLDPDAEHAGGLGGHGGRVPGQALATRLGIPLVYGVDSVHGHGNLVGATVFPHNIGLGATRDPRLVERIAQVTAEETRATGPQWIFAPCLCVARDLRWGRTYESFGEDPGLVARMAAAIDGLQGPRARGLDEPDRVLATAKHYAGDGDTEYGSAAGDYTIDQGITVTSRRDFARIDLAPYVPAVGTPPRRQRDAVVLQRRLDRGRGRQPAEDARPPRADHRRAQGPARLRRLRHLRLGGHPPDPRRLRHPGAHRRQRRHRHVHGAVQLPGLRDHPAGRGRRRPGDPGPRSTTPCAAS